MKSISSISVMISMLLINEHLNVKAECLPEGACYYDISVNQTKQSQCRRNGESWVYIYNGNNGCDMEYFHSVFKSSPSNQCCNIDPEVVGAPCNDVYNCDPFLGANAEYCGPQGVCKAPNTCITNGLGNGPHCQVQGDCNGACICDGLGGAQGMGICVPVGNLADESTQYSVTVINKAGQTIDVGIFQENPSDAKYEGDGALPIVFASQGISVGGEATFGWELEWGLSWSSGSNNDCTELSKGIIYSQSGEIVNVSPTDPDNNGAAVTYDQSNGVWEIKKSPDSSLKDELILNTDNSFTNQDAQNKCFTVCVTMNSNGKQTPIFAVNGIPNSQYAFKLAPKFYISRVSSKAGQTVSEQSTSSAYGPIEFNNNNDVTLCINDKNAFEECENENIF